jgi:hypothetical protein
MTKCTEAVPNKERMGFKGITELLECTVQCTFCAPVILYLSELCHREETTHKHSTYSFHLFL